MFVELRAIMRAALQGHARGSDPTASKLMVQAVLCPEAVAAALSSAWLNDADGLMRRQQSALRMHYRNCDVRWAVVAWASDHRVGLLRAGHLADRCVGTCFAFAKAISRP